MKTPEEAHSPAPGEAPDQRRSFRMDRIFFRRLIRLVIPYWKRPGAWKSWAALLFLQANLIAGSLLAGYSTTLIKRVTNTLLARDIHEFVGQISAWLVVGVGIATVFVLDKFVEVRLYEHWRRWLGVYMTDRYLSNRTYHRITLDNFIDNPDQRIANHTNSIPRLVSMAGLITMTSSNVFVFSSVLWSIDPTLFGVILMFAVTKFAVLYWVYQPVIRMTFDVAKSEGNWRRGLIHVQDNAESIAFYRGERQEARHLYARVYDTIRKTVRYRSYDAVVIAGTDRLFNLLCGNHLPFLALIVMVPIYLEGRIDFGTVAQGQVASIEMLAVITVAVAFLTYFASMAAAVMRLAEIEETSDQLLTETLSGSSEGKIDRQVALVPEIEFKAVTFSTPGGEQLIADALSFKVQAGDHLIIVGQTGAGKSSVLRAIAGLWTRGRGEIRVPPAGELLFLPQNPYIILSTLRDQLLYPHYRADISDEQLDACLAKVDLAGLPAKHGGWDAQLEWNRTLSLGEKQRIGFARALIAAPKFVFLDEATSALDIATETMLYRVMLASGATLISVGHRPSIYGFHRFALQMKGGGKWEILPIEKLVATSENWATKEALEDH